MPPREAIKPDYANVTLALGGAAQGDWAECDASGRPLDNASTHPRHHDLRAADGRQPHAAN